MGGMEAPGLSGLRDGIGGALCGGQQPQGPGWVLFSGDGQSGEGEGWA